MINKAGKHISFYYYGQDHLMLNLYKYVKTSLEINSYIYLYIDNHSYELLLSNLSEIEKNMVGKIDLDTVIASNYNKDNQFMTKCLKNYIKQKINIGYHKVGFIFDTKKIIESTSKELFKSIVSFSNKFSNEEGLDILSIYDFGEYMMKGKTIDDEIIKISYVEHTHRMFANEILPIDEFKNEKNLA